MFQNKSTCKVKMFNRKMRTNNRRSCSFRKNGGGFSVQQPLVSQPASDFTFAVKAPINMPYNDCTFAQRPGQLVNQANPDLAQVAMAGGGCGCSGPKWGGRRRSMRKKRAGRRSTRVMYGGSNGFAVNPSASIGGTGPNVAPVYSPVPCDARAGVHQPLMSNPDPRAPADLYSLTANQTGGAGNAYAAECYRATGSQLPVYNASSAGFTFSPSTLGGATLPDGVTAFNEVIPVAARTGGGRSRKHRKNRKNRKYSRKH